MIVKDGRATTSRYWDIDFSKEIRYGSDAEYAEHFTHVFKQCVHSRLRSQRPVGAYLSGGLDSSSVVSMAQMIYQEGWSGTGVLKPSRWYIPVCLAMKALISGQWWNAGIFARTICR